MDPFSLEYIVRERQAALNAEAVGYRLAHGLSRPRGAWFDRLLVRLGDGAAHRIDARVCSFEGEAQR